MRNINKYICIDYFSNKQCIIGIDSSYVGLNWKKIAESIDSGSTDLLCIDMHSFKVWCVDAGSAV